MQKLLKRGLANTAQLWPALQTAYRWIHQVAHILENHDKLDGAGVRLQFEGLLTPMQAQQESVVPLGDALTNFFKVTESYAPGLFSTYDKPGLPRTNNDLEQCFGSARRHERRATGRKGAVPGLVVRGSVRLLAAVAGIRQCFLTQALQMRAPQAWHDLREQLSYRREARRMQSRFRKNPAAYLAALEDKLIKASLPT